MYRGNIDKMLEITRFASAASSQLCCAGKLLSEAVRKKFTKADVVKRLMREHGAMFGALLETKKQKIRRLKLEKKAGVVATAKTTTGGCDSELAWMLRASDSRLRLIKLDSNDKLPILLPSPRKTPSELSRVQKRIIRKTSGSKAEKPRITYSESVQLPNDKLKKTQVTLSSQQKSDNSESLTDNKTNIDDTQVKHQKEEKNSYISQNVKSTKSKPSEFLTDDKTNLRETQVEYQREAKKNVKSEKPKPIETFADVETNPEETRVQYQREEKNAILLEPKKIIENISNASMYRKKVRKIAIEHDSEILSISPMENKDYFKFPSVTRILNATMSESAKKMLEQWMAKMIDQMGEEGFNDYKQGLLRNGRLLHSTIDGALRKTPVDVPENLKLCFDSAKIVLNEVRNVRAIESQVVHQELGYRGVVDCVASYRGKLCLIDWKKSDKTKHLLSSTYDAPLQIASYIGALNADENYPFQIKSGLLVIAYTMGGPPAVFTLDEKRLQLYWKQWLVRLKKYYTALNT